MPWITKPVPFNISQGAAVSAAVEQEWIPNLSGSAGEDGLATTNSAYDTWKSQITTGNPMIGYTLISIKVLWKCQTATPAAGTWQIKHFDSGGSQKGTTTSTTATPPSTSGSFSNETFDASNATSTIAVNDYFTLKCLETDDGNRSIVLRTYPTCTGDCQYSNTVLATGYSINPVESTWTFS